MAKQTYKIPADLNSSYGDMEIALQNENGIGVRPLPIKVIMAYILSGLSCFFLLMKTPIGSGTFVQTAIFVVLWAGLSIVLFRFDGTKRMQIETIPALLDYIPKANRYITTRTGSPATGFYNLARIKKIDKSTGLVEHVDGTFSYWYVVTGSASILLFAEDKMAILDHVESFYRKISTDCEVLFITTKSAQKVYKQLAHLKQRYDKMECRDPELIALANEQFHDLKDFVGVQFKSIHQYMILKADNKEALQKAKATLQMEVESSGQMIKHCSAMFYDDIIDVLSLIFRGTE